MGRGRRPNLSLEPTRSLQTQRAFRQRKAEHLAWLEESVKRLTGENEKLRKLLNLDPSQPLPDDGAATSTTTPPALNPCADAVKGEGAHSQVDQQLQQPSRQCPDCASLEETKEHLALAASQVESQMTSLNQAMVALRSVLATDRVTTGHKQSSGPTEFRPERGSTGPWNAPTPPGFHDASSQHHYNSQRRLLQNGVDAGALRSDEAGRAAKRPRMAGSESYPPHSHPASRCMLLDHTAVAGVMMTAPFYDRAHAGHEPTPTPSPGSGEMSRHLPSPFRAPQNLRPGSQSWPHASSPTAFAPSPPSDDPFIPHAGHSSLRHPGLSRGAWSTSSPSAIPPLPTSSNTAIVMPQGRDLNERNLAARRGYANTPPVGVAVEYPALHSPVASGSVHGGNYGYNLARPQSNAPSPASASSPGSFPVSRTSALSAAKSPYRVAHEHELIPTIAGAPSRSSASASGAQDRPSSRAPQDLDGEAGQEHPPAKDGRALTSTRDGRCPGNARRRSDGPSSALLPSSSCGKLGSGVPRTPNDVKPASTRGTAPAFDKTDLASKSCGVGTRGQASACCAPKAQAQPAEQDRATSSSASFEGQQASDGVKTARKTDDEGRPRRLSSPPPPIGLLVDMRNQSGNPEEPCCFGLVECDAEGRILL